MDAYFKHQALPNALHSHTDTHTSTHTQQHTRTKPSTVYYTNPIPHNLPTGFCTRHPGSVHAAIIVRRLHSTIKAAHRSLNAPLRRERRSDLQQRSSVPRGCARVRGNGGEKRLTGADSADQGHSVEAAPPMDGSNAHLARLLSWRLQLTPRTLFLRSWDCVMDNT